MPPNVPVPATPAPLPFLPAAVLLGSFDLLMKTLTEASLPPELKKMKEVCHPPPLSLSLALPCCMRARGSRCRRAVLRS